MNMYVNVNCIIIDFNPVVSLKCTNHNQHVKNLFELRPKDMMESFFLGKMLKYLYLLFANDHEINLKHWVFKILKLIHCQSIKANVSHKVVKAKASDF